jgi:hypothetical protein
LNDLAGLCSNAFSQGSFSNLERQVCRLTEELRRRLDLCPAANQNS